MKTTIRKPKGQFKVILRHRNLRGHVFRPDETYNYYGTSMANSCGCNRMPLIKMYHTLKGLIPENKIKIL